MAGVRAGGGRNDWEFEADRKFIPETLKSQEVRRMLMAEAELAVTMARRPAPRGFRRDTGENVRKIRTYSTMGPDDSMSRDDRWVAHVEMYAPHALVREFGTPHAYFTRFWSAPEAVLHRISRELSSPDP